jgi:hypothetical protein
LSRGFPARIRTFPDLREGFLPAALFITHSDGPAGPVAVARGIDPAIRAAW